MKQVSAAILVIGDEILSGRTRDINVQNIAQFLAPLGINIQEVRIIPDEREVIFDAVNTLRAHYRYLFTTGGLGPTHDDITAECVAAAFGVDITIREDARAILEAWYAKSGTEVTEARLRMARIPDGATLIDNPVTGAPGFQLENVFVMAGVPKIARAMLEDIVARLEGGAVTQSISVRHPGLREGDVSKALGELAKAHPAVSLGSYPWFDVGEDGKLSGGVELVARSTDAGQLEAIKPTLEGFAALIKA